MYISGIECTSDMRYALILLLSTSTFGHAAQPHRELLFGRLFKALAGNRSRDIASTSSRCMDVQPKECKEWASAGECSNNVRAALLSYPCTTCGLAERVQHPPARSQLS